MYGELVGFGNNKRLVQTHFDKTWMTADVDWQHLAIKWLESHNDNYMPLTDRARKELIMLLLNSTMDKVKGFFTDCTMQQVLDNKAVQGDVLVAEERELVTLKGDELATIYVACGGTTEEAKNLVKKSKAHIAQAIWKMAMAFETKPRSVGAAGAVKNPGTGKGFMGHREGSKKEQAHRIFAVGGTRAEIVEKIVALGIQKSTAASWYGVFKKQAAAVQGA